MKLKFSMHFGQFNLFKKSLRCDATFIGRRGTTSKAIVRAIGYGDDRHCIAAVDWLTVHFIHGKDKKPHVGWTGGPFG